MKALILSEQMITDYVWFNPASLSTEQLIKVVEMITF